MNIFSTKCEDNNLILPKKYISLDSFQLDLRSTKGLVRIQKGLSVRLLRVVILVFLDILALLFASRITTFISVQLYSNWIQKTPFLIVSLALQIGIIAAAGLYKAGNHRRDYPGLFKAVSLSQLFLLLIAFVYEPNQYSSQSNFIISWLLSVVLICTVRYIFDIATKVLREKKAIRHPIFLITDAEEQDNCIKVIEQENCYALQGIADSSCLDISNREKTFEFLRDKGIVEAFVSWNAIKNRLYVFWNFYTAGITLQILPTKSELNHPKSIYSMIGEVPCMTISAPIIAGTDFLLKRYFDFFCSIILLFLLSPVYLAIAILIKLDSPGPVFFIQDRIGLNSQKFKIWKFRTMVANAEQQQIMLEAKNEIKNGVLFKIKDDPRITRAGKFLRHYSLDELPQLFNVFLGEMSLVGPRPFPLRDVERFNTKHFIRQKVLPGITGLWQVSGRSNILDFEECVKLDIEYIQNWSLWLDLEILLKTVRVVLQKTGAY